MPTANSPTVEVAQISIVIDKCAAAIQAKDSNSLMSHYAPDVLLFDLINPIQRTGREAGRKRADEWFRSFRGPIGYETRNLTIAACEDVAFCHCLNGVSGTRTDGTKIAMWWRTTICLRRKGGEWMITHEHSSVPFDMESGRASLNLQP